MRCAAFLVAALLPVLAVAQGNPQGGKQPSVLVSTETPHRGSLPRMLAAYGVVQASPEGGSETMSLLRGGQVTAVTTFTGQAVHKGQPLLVVRADPAEVATYRQAVAALALARGDRARAAKMLSQHLATRDQLAQANKAVADAQATLDALKRAGGGAEEQTLSAPFDGIVSNLMVSRGARVAAQAPLLMLTRSARLVAIVGVEPAQRGLVAPGQPARIEPLYGGDSESGSVVSVGAMLDPRSRLVPVVVDPPDHPAPAGAIEDPRNAGGLLPGSPVQIMIKVGEMQGWLVPRDAVLTDANGPYLFQLSGGKAVRANVKIVGTSAATTVVDGPIDPGRLLVTAGNYQLEDGMAVRTNPANGTTKP